jgi:hypothetical protein
MSVLLAAAPASAQVTPLGASFPVPAGVLSSMAYDEQNQVYLHVWEFNRDIWARFIAPDGTPVGVPFSAAPHKQSFAGRPKIAYGAGEFLLIYVSDYNQYDVGSNVFGQIVAYTGGGPAGGGIFGDFIPISPRSNLGGTYQVPADVAYNPLTQRFLVAYDELFSEGWEAMVRLFQPDGAPAADPVAASNGPGSQGATALAFDWEQNKFFAAYIGDNPEDNTQLGLFGRILDGNTAAAGPQLLVQPGFVLEPATAFMPEADGFLVTFTAFTPTRDVWGKYVSTSGALPLPVYAVMASPFINEGAATLDYDYRSRTMLAAAMTDPLYISGTVMDAAGGNPSATFQLSTVVNNPGTGAPLSIGSFFPVVRRSDNGVYGVSYGVDYSWGIFERFQLPLAGTPGPHYVPSGVVFTVSPPAWSVPATGGTQLVTLTTSDQGAAWTVSTGGATWLTSDVAGGTGNGAFTLTAAENTGTTSRAATVFAGGKFIAVAQQAPSNGQVTPLGASSPTPAGVLSSVAYDSVNNVYLHVWEYNRDVWARFISADGILLGVPFVTAPYKQSFAGKPKVAYGSGKFLVIYASDVNWFDVGSNVFGQMVVYTGTGASGGGMVGGTIFVSPFSQYGGVLQFTGDVIYNPRTQRFLVAYDEIGSDRESMVRQFAVDGTPIAGPVNVSNGPGSQGATQLAYDWEQDKYLAVYIGDNPEDNAQIGVFVRVLDGNTAAASNQIVVSLGFIIEPAVAFMPEADGFLVTWTGFTPGRDVLGRYVPTAIGTGALPLPAYGVLASPFVNEGGASLDYDSYSRLMLIAAMDDSLRMKGTVMDAAGGNPSAPFLLSTVAPALGSFFPTVRAAEAGLFAMSYTIDYSWAYFERYQLPVAPVPGPRCCGTGGTPEFSVTPPSWNPSGAGGNLVVTVTSADPTWTWTVTTGAAWLTPSVAGGTGSGTVTLTAGATSTSRTATVAIAGHTMNVSQAAVGDVFNGNFSSGLSSWSTFAVPSDALVASVTNGVLEFYRQPAPPGTQGQASIFQSTGAAYGAATQISADFDLGNSSIVWKRITVLLHDLNFSDLHMCTFWLAPNAPMRTYSMRSHTNQPWANATVSFYAVTEGSNGGAYRLDNVRVYTIPGQSVERTDCVDPLAPPAAGFPDGPPMIANGDFGNGLVAWGTYGQLTHQVASGVFQFVRPAGTPAGVVLQHTGASIAASSIMTATFSLGNSSGVRKRVTAVIHDWDFNDLGACTFWLEPGEALSSFTMRMFNTRPWLNATFAVYPSVVNTEQWIRLDDVNFRLTPNTPIVGTECIEPPTAFGPAPAPALAASPGAGVQPPLAGKSTPSRTEPRIGGAGEWAVGGRFAALEAGGDVTRGRAWGAVITESETHTLAWRTPIDLRDATSAMLRFESRLSSGLSTALVEVSRDGLTWTAVGVVPPSDDWTNVAVDLSAFAGDVIFVRFVYAGVAPGLGATSNEAWYLSGVSVDTRAPLATQSSLRRFSSTNR